MLIGKVIVSMAMFNSEPFVIPRGSLLLSEGVEVLVPPVTSLATEKVRLLPNNQSSVPPEEAMIS